MKTFLIIAALAASVSGEPPGAAPTYGAPGRYQASEPQYGVPAGPFLSGGYPSGQPGYDVPSGAYGPPVVAAPVPVPQYGAPVGQVYRHIYVHAAPDEPVYNENKVIRVPGGGDKHVNIIFVKAPSHSSQQQTEVILPEQPQQKTVVYVLVKKPESYNNVKVSGPAPRPQPKPEVFFIRYKNKEEGGYGIPAAPPAQEYGAPQLAAPTPGGYQ